MLLFILDDLFGIKLWGENIFRRVLHHISNNNFNSNKFVTVYLILFVNMEKLTVI